MKCSEFCFNTAVHYRIYFFFPSGIRVLRRACLTAAQLCAGSKPAQAGSVWHSTATMLYRNHPPAWWTKPLKNSARTSSTTKSPQPYLFCVIVWKWVHFRASQLSHTLCGCESSPSRQSQNQNSPFAPWCHLPWSQHHPGCSPCASSSAPGEFVGSCFGLGGTLKEILLGGSSWGHPPSPRNELMWMSWRVSSSPATPHKNARHQQGLRGGTAHGNLIQTTMEQEQWLCQDTKLASWIQQKPEAPKCDSSHSHKRLDNA